ncbi:MAG: 3'-5' exonuclease [Pseudomonadota bacterium]|nr:3'-5' exonuclease [Pseudomonadota bacterium]
MKELVIVCKLEAIRHEDDASVSIELMEVVEIGCVLCDLNGNVVDEFDTFVKPVRNPTLNAFYTQLTGITKIDIYSAPTFKRAMMLLDDWAYNCNTMWASWGLSEYILLRGEQVRTGVESEFMCKPHIDLREGWRRVAGAGRGKGLAYASRTYILDFDRAPQRALTDARNTARVLQYLPYSEISRQASEFDISARLSKRRMNERL